MQINRDYSFVIVFVLRVTSYYIKYKENDNEDKI